MMEEFGADGKGSPTRARRRLFDQVLKSLAKAQGKPVVYSTFVATICVDTGLIEKTVETMFEVLEKAKRVDIDLKKDQIWLAGAEE